MSASRNCHDCGAEPSQPHVAGCDVARCLWTGGQRIQCQGSGVFNQVIEVLQMAGRDELAVDLADELGIDGDHDCGSDIWTGEWPGDADCRRLDFWCFWGPDYGQRGWVSCDKDHPGAREDLNRLMVEAEWDREQEMWVAR